MELLTDHTVQVVSLGSAILGAVGGVLGSFAVLRRQSLLGDALSHAALPGICLAFLLTASKAPLVLMVGAGLAGWLGTIVVQVVVRRSRVPFDSALGMVLSVFFGLGLVLLTLIQRLPDAAQAGLDTYLFGQAAALLERDVATMAILGGIALLAVLALWPRLKVLAFDREFGASLGLPMGVLDGILTALLVVAIVIGLQTVGVVLMSAMIVAPGAAARQWTDRLGVMVTLAAFFGAASGVTGAVLSSVVPRLPTGPTIVLALTAIVVASLLVAPARGLVWRRVRLARTRRRSPAEPVLLHLYALSLQHDDPGHGHGLGVLRTMSPPGADVAGALATLRRRGLVEPVDDERWAPTPLGRRDAERVLDRGRAAEEAS